MKATRIIRTVGLLLLTALSVNVIAQTGEIRGTVTDSASGNPLADVIVTMMYKGQQKLEITDAEGKYAIKPLDPGTYTLTFDPPGTDPYTVGGVVVSPEKIAFVDQSIMAGVIMPDIKVYANKINMTTDETHVTIDFADIQKGSVGRDVPSMISVIPGVQMVARNQISIRGSRPDATQYYVDGVKVYGEPYIPMQGIEDITVMTGGLPAKYGDTTSGVVLITTRSFR